MFRLEMGLHQALGATPMDARDLVARNVFGNVSDLIAYLAKRYNAGDNDPLTLEAADLQEPLLDYEEAARDAGWEENYGAWEKDEEREPTAQDACELEHIEPYESEILEHWIVSDTLARRLSELGERVGPLGSLKVWGRATSGQAIHMDAVIRELARGA